MRAVRQFSAQGPVVRESDASHGIPSCRHRDPDRGCPSPRSPAPALRPREAPASPTSAERAFVEGSGARIPVRADRYVALRDARNQAIAEVQKFRRGTARPGPSSGRSSSSSCETPSATTRRSRSRSWIFSTGANAAWLPATRKRSVESTGRSKSARARVPSSRSSYESDRRAGSALSWRSSRLWALASLAHAPARPGTTGCRTRRAPRHAARHRAARSALPSMWRRRRPPGDDQASTSSTYR